MSATVTVENLELSQIVPSTTNPRKSFDQVALEQLAESIKEIGVTVPILVRMKRDSFGNVDLDHRQSYLYELVSGHRRLKAAQIAGLDDIPAFIRELSDAEALDIQMVENLQRADLHPMDEAAGYQALIDAAADRGVALTQEELAHKVGKPLSYVAQRVKLLDLTETPRKVFQEGLINIGHALLLAKLTPELQSEGLRQVFDPGKRYGKTKDVAEVVEKAVEYSKPDADDHERYQRDAAQPVTALKNWIKFNVELDLGEAPWDLAAENLHPSASSCNACPKRTGNNPALFSEMTAGEDKCMDPECFDVKTKTFVHITVTGPTATGKPMLRLSDNWSHNPLDGTEKAINKGQWVEAQKKGSCPDAREGVTISGNKTGEILWVCINQKCKVHKHTVTQPQEARVSAAATSKMSPVEREEAEEKKKLAEERKVAERMALYIAIRAEAAKGDRDAALVEYVVYTMDRETTVDPENLFKLNAWEIPQGRWQEQRAVLVEKIRTLKGKAFVAYVFDLTYGSLSEWQSWSERDDNVTLDELLQKYGVDVDAVLAKLKLERPELYPADKPKPAKPAPKTPAKKAIEAAVAKRMKAAKKKTAAKKVPAKKAARATGKAAAANDVDDGELDELADNLTNTPGRDEDDDRELSDDADDEEDED
jgi:ParB family chromosome partitioning protein